MIFNTGISIIVPGLINKCIAWILGHKTSCVYIWVVDASSVHIIDRKKYVDMYHTIIQMYRKVQNIFTGIMV